MLVQPNVSESTDWDDGTIEQSYTRLVLPVAEGRAERPGRRRRA